jgi:hypothetical protein
MSGGENQSPYFVAILASYLRAYKRHERRWNDPSLALVPIDEALRARTVFDGDRFVIKEGMNLSLLTCPCKSWPGGSSDLTRNTPDRDRERVIRSH